MSNSEKTRPTLDQTSDLRVWVPVAEILRNVRRRRIWCPGSNAGVATALKQGRRHHTQIHFTHSAVWSIQLYMRLKQV